MHHNYYHYCSLQVEMHQIKEMKNTHINRLLEGHKKSFDEMKMYYHEITKANLKLIKEFMVYI